MHSDLKKNTLIGVSSLLALTTAVSTYGANSTANSSDDKLEEITVTGSRSVASPVCTSMVYVPGRTCGPEMVIG